MKCSFLVVLLCCSANIYCTYIEENEYKGISISFSSKVKQESVDLKKLKAVLQRASEYLYHATRKRSYFGEFILSVPSSWSLDEGMCQKTIDSSEDIDIYITESIKTPVIKAQHSRGCGRKGDIIYMPLSWLQGRKDRTEDLARQFVQQWAIFRYGVFEEKPDVPGSCFIYRKSWFPSGCYNVPLDLEPTMDENGLPVCNLPVDFYDKGDLKSSIMFTANSSKVMNFCDGSSAFPHNAVIPTPHNRLCEGKTSWSVIKDSEDFKYGRNPTKEGIEFPKTTAFRCLQEQQIHLTLAVQTGCMEDISMDLVEIRYILYRFLRNMASQESKVNLVTFWGMSPPKTENSTNLNLRNADQLYSVLNERIRLFAKNSDVCLSCGLQTAFNTSLIEHPFPVVVVIAWESVLETEKESDMLAIIQRNKRAVLYLILVEDTDSDLVSSNLVAVVRNTGGQILKLAKEKVFRPGQLSVILANAFKNPMRIEDEIIVVHEASYTDVRSDITDSFRIPMNATGKLMYMMHCNKKDDIDIGSESSNCVNNWGETSNTCTRAELTNIDDEHISNEAWTYKYKYNGKTDSLVCSSLAIMKLSSSVSSFTLRGWLSDNQITPGHNALIIYAEAQGSSEQNIAVVAKISGPGMKEPVKIELRDNGNGDPDTERGDGIYCRYFTAFRQKGTYAVTISAQVTNKHDQLMAGGNENSDILVQSKAIGSFMVLEAMPDVDILPPNRIVDLAVKSVNNENNTITLSWTAPGDDYDNGTVAECKVYFTEDWKDLQEEMLEKVYMNTLVADGSFDLNPAGKEEMQQFEMPNGSLYCSYYMAISCEDQNKNKGRISNIIQVLTNFQNITGKNDSENSTETSTSSNVISEQDKSMHLNFYILISGISGIIIIMIILINIIIWVTCFRKFKKVHKPFTSDSGSENDAKILTNSKDVTFKNEYDVRHAYINQTMDENSSPPKSRTDHANDDLSHSSVVYAKVCKEKRNANQATLTVQSKRAMALPGNIRNGESDLGYV